MNRKNKGIDELCVNAIRFLSIDAIEKAKSGHPGLPMGAAPMAYALWQKHLRHNPKDPKWPDRDRFVLSAGHGSMLLYSLLHLTGYDLTMEDLLAFRQWGSRTPGHPESILTSGVEATTGPLGQGSANAVGMAMAERFLANRFNRPDFTLVDHYTYALVSDGDLMEGISAEASSLAGHLKLGKLIYLYDSNQISLDGPITKTFSGEVVANRYDAYGWQILNVFDGNNDVDAIDQVIQEAKADLSRPSLILINTLIAYGSPNKMGSSEAHGSPLGEDEIRLTKRFLGWDPDAHFYIPEEVLTHFRSAVTRGEKLQKEWEERFEAYSQKYPDLAQEWRQALSGELPPGWDQEIPQWGPKEKLATRQAGGKALNAIATRVPWLIGGDADLAVSTNTTLKDAGSFNGQTGAGRNIHFGVREHAMGGIVNGMAYHGGVRPFAATFFCFSDYMRPSVRLAALSELPVIYVWTHDSIGLGEDGPTHEPIEHLMSLRAMPNLVVIRPADANETAEAWRYAMQHRKGPVALVLTRQALPVIDRERYAPASGLAKGAYVLADVGKGLPQAIIIATGSEVSIALSAQEALAVEGIATRVVSMPSWELFKAQSQEYRDSVLPPQVKARVSVEAGVTLSWSHWIGDHGVAIGIDRFGASAPGNVNMEKFGFTPENIVQTVRQLLKEKV
jgi:transketolase